MSNSNYRWYEEIRPKDNLSKASKVIEMNSTRHEPKFTNKDSQVATTFRLNTYLMNIATVPYTYSGEFTICFWAKFVDKNKIDEAYPNSIRLILNDGTSVGATLPSTIGTNKTPVTYTDWNWYKIERNSNNVISIKVNNEEIASATNSALLDLNDKSYLFLGNLNKNFTGYDVTVDDILIFGGTCTYLNNIPTDYLELTKFYKLIYIKSSDNSVWAMREETT